MPGTTRADADGSRAENAPRRIGFVVLLAFLLMGVVAVSPAIFSTDRIAALDVPDTWCHTWIFWRTRYALEGGDHGYLLSHVLSYPGVIREPMAVFDPLLAWMSLPLQMILPSIAAVYNSLVALGLGFTAFFGYLFCRGRGMGQWGAILAGTVTGFNPFLFRILLGGYSEYAWWGLIPLALFFGDRAERSRRPTAVLPYILTLWFLGFFSLYLAAYLAGVVACLFVARLLRSVRSDRSVLKPFVRVQLQAFAALLPLFLFWGVHLSSLEFKGFQWGRPFDLKALSAEGEVAERFVGPVLRLPEDPPGDETKNFMPYRTLRGSLDLADGLPFAGRGRPGWLKNVPDEIPGGILAFEQTSWWEWIALLALAIVGLTQRGRRGWVLGWLVVAGLFAVMSLGPHLKWRGDVYALTMPYGWLYQWVPGAARLNVPGRAFLVAIMALAAAAGAGVDVLVDARRFVFATRAIVGLALIWQLGLGLASHGGWGFPSTSADVPSFYHDIGGEPGDFALLELPTRGAIDKRMYWQAFHGRPIYKGVAASEWTDVDGMQPVETNAVIKFLEQQPFRPDPEPAGWERAVDALESLGFRYLVLHADGYGTPGEFLSAFEVMTKRQGAPRWNEDGHAVWQLEP